MLLASSATEAFGTLVVYYDPETGNVALDTSSTRDGVLYGYSFWLDINKTDIRFNPEELVRISPSTLLIKEESTIQHWTLANPPSGLLTLGNVLPPGIEASVWSRLFASENRRDSDPDALGSHLYRDIPTGSWDKPLPDFRYGAPTRPFDNRWDIVDPDELAWASQATLRYHEATGELKIDTTGPASGHITTFTLESDGAFLADNFDPFITVPLTIANDSTLFIAADAIEPGVHSLGHVLEAGLSKTEFEAVFTEAMFIARAGFGGASFDFETDGLPMQLAYVTAIPEPSAALPALIAACLVSYTRRP